MSLAVPSFSPPHRTFRMNRQLAVLTVGAIGVVFGDIGTSPLYAFREALALCGDDGFDASEILGVSEIRNVITKSLGSAEGGFYSSMGGQVLQIFENKGNRQRLKKTGISLRISEYLHNRWERRIVFVWRLKIFVCLLVCVCGV